MGDIFNFQKKRLSSSRMTIKKSRNGRCKLINCKLVGAVGVIACLSNKNCAPLFMPNLTTVVGCSLYCLYGLDDVLVCMEVFTTLRTCSFVFPKLNY